MGLKYTGNPGRPHKTPTEEVWFVGSSREVQNRVAYAKEEAK